MPPRRAANHKIYQRFAEVYDAMGADQHSRYMVEYTYRIARKFGLDIATVLDLCCGTGSALRLYSELGWNATGIDASPAMLAAAKQKLKKYKVTLYHQALPRFEIPVPGDGFDLVTSFYDSLNYMLTKADLKAAFRSAFRHLRPGGLFVFDMNTAEALKVIWDGHIYADTRDDLAWVWKNVYDPSAQTADCIATFFVKTGHHWERFTEIHTERAYPNSEIKKLLRDVGFVIKGFYRCRTFEPAAAKSYRICAVAQKPTGTKKAAR
jgi:SAM-dependent methyltransferase